MYNTLEFFTDVAVKESQDELADIIYEFSSLLRNNISDEQRSWSRVGILAENILFLYGTLS